MHICPLNISLCNFQPAAYADGSAVESHGAHKPACAHTPLKDLLHVIRGSSVISQKCCHCDRYTDLLALGVMAQVGVSKC